MNAKQLSMAMEIAQDKTFKTINENGVHLVDTSIFDGFGLPDFEPVYCTLEQVAALIRWQCFRMNGSIDGDNLAEIAHAGKKRFIVVGRGGPNASTLEDDMAWWNTQSGNHPAAGYISENELSKPLKGHWYAEITMGDGNNVFIRIDGMGDTFTEAVADCRSRVKEWLNKNVYKIGAMNNADGN